MYTILIELVVAAALAIGGAWAMHHHDAKEIANITADNASLMQANTRLVAQSKIDNAAVVSLAATRAEMGRSHALAGHSLAAAAASSPSWAQTAVPKEVQDALRP
jgi:hypothetical protein